MIFLWLILRDTAVMFSETISFSIDLAPGMAAVCCGDLPLDESDAIVTWAKSPGCTIVNPWCA